MPKTISTQEAKNYVIKLISGRHYGNWTPNGFSLSQTTTQACLELAHIDVVKPLNESRISASGNQLDLYADSAWHALCALLFQEIYSRINRGTFQEAVANFEQTFGRRLFYRGQSRPWDIFPSAWRSQERSDCSKIMIGEFSTILHRHLQEHPDPIMLMSGRENMQSAIVGLAQHYGLPTNFIDLSFDPMTAVAFACGDEPAAPHQPRDLSDPKLEDCAVVYVIAAPALINSSKPKFEFPPAYSKRLYQQKGLFVDFGNYPGVSVVQNANQYDYPWQWLQQNCQRVFFPRTYPVAQGVDEMREHELMAGDEFLLEVSDMIKAGLGASDMKCKKVPSWHINVNDMEKLGLASVQFIQRIDSYLRHACLIKFEDCNCLDPYLLAFMRNSIKPELQYLQNTARLANHQGLSWIAKRLTDAERVIEDQLLSVL